MICKRCAWAMIITHDNDGIEEIEVWCDTIKAFLEDSEVVKCTGYSRLSEAMLIEREVNATDRENY